MSWYTDEQLRDMLDNVWLHRMEIEKTAAQITETLIFRELKKQFPTVHTVTLMEDTSHDGPHGHFSSCADKHHETLIASNSEKWNDLPISYAVDEYAYDLYPLVSTRFEYNPETNKREYVFTDEPGNPPIKPAS